MLHKTRRTDVTAPKSPRMLSSQGSQGSEAAGIRVARARHAQHRLPHAHASALMGLWQRQHQGPCRKTPGPAYAMSKALTKTWTSRQLDPGSEMQRQLQRAHPIVAITFL